MRRCLAVLTAVFGMGIAPAHALAACPAKQPIIRRVKAGGVLLVLDSSGYWIACAAGRRVVIGDGLDIARRLTAGRYTALVFGDGVAQVAVFDHRLRHVASGRIRPLPDASTFARIVAVRLGRSGSLVFGIDGGGRHGVYVAHGETVTAVDVRHGVDPRSGVPDGALIRWRWRGNPHASASLAWDALPSDCRLQPAADHVVMGTGAELYELTRFTADPLDDFELSNVYGCTGAGPPRQLGEVRRDNNPGGTTVLDSPFAASGAFGVVELWSYVGPDAVGHVDSIDLRTGSTVATASLEFSPGYEGVRRAVVSPDTGSFAFASTTTTWSGDLSSDVSMTASIRAADRSGDRTLDGPTSLIDPRSLGYANGAITWLDDLAWRTAPLP